MAGRSTARLWLLSGLVFIIAVGAGAYFALQTVEPPADPPRAALPPPEPRPRRPFDSSGNIPVTEAMERWPAAAPLKDVARCWEGAPGRLKARLDAQLAHPRLLPGERISALIALASWHHFHGHPDQAYAVLGEARALAEATPADSANWRATVVYYQGLTGLRRGETENCVMCRGESSCILPLAPAALHTNPAGSRLAIKHFTEYLEMFPDDFQVRWLLNLAHMTLGEHPSGVDPRFVIRLDGWAKSEFDIGRFRDIGADVGINRFNEAGATVLDDFDNDGLFDILFTAYNAARPIVLYKNLGNGKFADVTEKANLRGQLGELGAAQADFDNDGHLDFFLPRGAWQPNPIRPSLMRNNGDGTFADVTEKAGLLASLNSDTVAWADFDNDGFVDLFVACERQPCRLYRNKGNGTFEDVSDKAGFASHREVWKGVAWIDYDNDRFPDLFLSSLSGPAVLFRNNHNGTFTEVTRQMGIDGPSDALSCWAFDYDNDGFIDIFAPCYKGDVETVVKGMLGAPPNPGKNRLYRNLGGKKFQDVSKEAGLDASYAAMGMNFGDFDNDGFLDFYLGTGDHDLATLVPNRMFKNVGGKRFADVTASSGTGNLQKGHGVGCGDWDRNGTVDIVIQMGGPLPGDSYHNILFQNPGQRNNWLSVKLVGKKTNRSAIGARIKAATAGPDPLTVYRVVTSGCSFGGNPLEQHLGLAKADTVATLEIYWPTSGTTQVFRDVPANRAIEITEFATGYRALDHKPVVLPK
jgi:hypothetical protein